MPEDLKKSFCFILSEASDAAAKWKLAMQLFGKSEARCTLLSQTGAVFFALTRDALITDALLTLGRLLDKPQQGRSNNLCLEYLLDSIRARNDNDLASELEAVLKDARRSEDKARKHRNKRIAHNDLLTNLDDAGSPLPNATVGKMNELLESTQVFLNKIDMYYLDQQQSSASPWESHQRATTVVLMHHLRTIACPRTGSSTRRGFPSPISSRPMGLRRSASRLWSLPVGPRASIVRGVGRVRASA